ELSDEEKISYEGMVNLLNIQSIMEEEPGVDLEDIMHKIKEVLLDTGIPEEIVIDPKLKEELAALLGLDQDNKNLDELSKDELKDLIIDKLDNMDQNEDTKVLMKALI